MLKYDYFSAICSLTEKSCETVEYSFKLRSQTPLKISRIRAEVYKTVYEIESALFSDFLPPLDRASLAAYSHTLRELTDTALVYSRCAPPQYVSLSSKGFESSCSSLCEMLKAGSAMLDKIKKSSETPRIDEFRRTKSKALESICDGSLTPQVFAARQELLLSISAAFDALIVLMLENI